MMRTLTIAFWAAFAVSTATAQQYGGGPGDGHQAATGTLTFDDSPIAVLYGGGDGDGHDADLGTLTLDAGEIALLYGGGGGDGHDARSGTLEFSAGTLTSLYGGGDGDGHDAVTGTITLEGGSLPATLLTFTAEPTDAGTVRIAWTVADERDVAHYAVERGPDARAFAEVGREPAAAPDVTSTHAYGLTDPTPLAGASYYRLRTIDLDGSTELSDVVVVLLPGGDEAWTLAVFPNPASVGQPLRLASEGLDTATPLTLSVHDATGRLLTTRQLVSAGGRETFEVPALGLSPGTYHLRLTHPELGVRGEMVAITQ